MTDLVDIERPLALFAEGIAGHYCHLKIGDGEVADRNSVFLPESIDLFEEDDWNAGAYRLKVLLQLGFQEFGTFDFDIARARILIPDLGARERPESHRESDLTVFFNHFDAPSLARRLFHVLEHARIEARALAKYPGARKYRDALRAPHAAASGFPARRRAGSARPERHGVHDGRLGRRVLRGACPGSTALPEPRVPGTDGVAAARGTPRGLGGRTSTRPGPRSPPSSWPRRAARSRSETATGETATSATSDGISSASGTSCSAASTWNALPCDIASAMSTRPPAVSATNEWDYLHHGYKRGWCRLFEETLAPDDDAESRKLIDAVRPHASAVRRRFGQIRPAGYQRVAKVADGDELDLNTLVDVRCDLRAGVSPDDRVYSRRDRVRRDVGAALLVDLSASTDDPLVEKPAPDPADGRGASRGAATQKLRDPWFDDDDDPYAVLDNPPDAAERRRIIDIQKEAVALLATALEGIGDRYGVYGFSGYGRDCVEFYVAKELDQALDRRALDAIAAMKPKRSTRMGPAIRHAATKLQSSGAALKVLMILSDGFPQDCDYGPKRGDHEYGLRDTAKALEEAERAGVYTFCITVDRSGHDYLRRMCPDARYMVIEETEELPDALQKAYRRLTQV